MDDKVMKSLEVQTLAANLNKIELHLGRSVPVGVLDMEELSDHVLSNVEVQTIVANLTKLNLYRNSTKGEVRGIESLLMWLFLGYAAMELICVFCFGFSPSVYISKLIS